MLLESLVQVRTKRCGMHFWDFRRQVENFENGHQAEVSLPFQCYLFNGFPFLGALLKHFVEAHLFGVYRCDIIFFAVNVILFFQCLLFHVRAANIHIGLCSSFVFLLTVIADTCIIALCSTCVPAVQEVHRHTSTLGVRFIFFYELFFLSALAIALPVIFFCEIF
jgi:hypothetical protein